MKANEVEIKAIALEDDLFLTGLGYTEKLTTLIKTANEKNMTVYIRETNTSSNKDFTFPSEKEVNYKLINQNNKIPDKESCLFVTIPDGTLYTTSTSLNKHVIIKESSDFDNFFDVIDHKKWISSREVNILKIQNNNLPPENKATTQTNQEIRKLPAIPNKRNSSFVDIHQKLNNMMNSNQPNKELNTNQQSQKNRGAPTSPSGQHNQPVKRLSVTEYVKLQTDNLWEVSKLNGELTIRKGDITKSITDDLSSDECKNISDAFTKSYGLDKVPVIMLLDKDLLIIEFNPACSDNHKNLWAQNWGERYSATLCQSDPGTTLFSIQNQGNDRNQIEKFVTNYNCDANKLYSEANSILLQKQENQNPSITFCSQQ